MILTLAKIKRVADAYRCVQRNYWLSADLADCSLVHGVSGSLSSILRVENRQIAAPLRAFSIA